MFEYIVQIELEGGARYLREGSGDVLHPDIQLATRYSGYYQALNRLVRILTDNVLIEPVQIRIAPSPESWDQYRESWSMEDILRSAG
jgi:hypothetical protein